MAPASDSWHKASNIILPEDQWWIRKDEARLPVGINTLCFSECSYTAGSIARASRVNISAMYPQRFPYGLIE